jgi:hypothetical protein
MAAKIRKLAGNSKLVAAAPVTSLAIHTAVHVGRATMFVSLSDKRKWNHETRPFRPAFSRRHCADRRRAAMTGFNMPPGTNRPDIPRDGEDDPFFEMVWNKLAGRVPDDDVAEIAKWIADLISDAREDGLWEA